MHVWTGEATTSLTNLTDRISELIMTLKNSARNSIKSSEALQKKLIFWTKIMAGAIIIPAIAIGVHIYFQYG